MARMGSSGSGDGYGGSSLTSSWPARSGWCWMKGKTIGAVARELDLTPSSLGELGATRTGRSDERPDGADDRGARRIGQPAERQSRVAHGARHPKKSRGLFRQAPGVVFAWIDAEKAEFPITKLCQYLQVSPSGFYAARGRPESAHAQTDRRLRVLVRASFDESRQRYGSPRIHEDLVEQAGPCQSEAHHAFDAGRRPEARARKRFKCTTMSDHDQPVAANVLDRRFEAAGPNQRWVGDTTEFVIGGSGKLYLAAVLDLFSRFVVGWAVSAVNDRHLAIRALAMALKRRCPRCRSATSLRSRAIRATAQARRSASLRSVLMSAQVNAKSSPSRHAVSSAAMMSHCNRTPATLSKRRSSPGRRQSSVVVDHVRRQAAMLLCDLAALEHRGGRLAVASHSTHVGAREPRADEHVPERGVDGPAGQHAAVWCAGGNPLQSRCNLGDEKSAEKRRDGRSSQVG